ncbi:hypothetical protein VTJ83DRAFT_2705 [Remersonia thermophila]|uniref:Secreted protein n=1 Tax=Remersonia thermophila TaxID=72144 RepID=A0ABR4DJS5_9PEZI
MLLHSVLAVSLGSAVPVLGAATKWYSDPDCQNFIGKKVYNGFSTGDAIVPPDGVQAIKVDSLMSVWFAYEGTTGSKCLGNQLRVLPEGKCIRIANPEDPDALPVRCTRICSGGIGGTAHCAPTVIE